ncbi:site-specific integrase [Aquimarina sp. TRL1]|uniref:tyrosine-type recombinase/integrase n=1 Tax=Aquimarina sp. (strain TRL1) TaxID=2736252 RepID=UPI0020CAD243|nr:site-specific integrase [Aquimarina sp. TRL1]
MNEMRLYDTNGDRLYLTPEERKLFIDCAKEQPNKVMTFALTLAYTGCRISEALEITPSRIDLDQKQILLRSLKKRKNDVYRTVPVPNELIDPLVLVYDLIKIKKSRGLKAIKPLWTWTRQHSYEIIKKVMIDAGIPEGKHRMPKGLRHAFGVNAIVNGVPESRLQKWMGHSDLKTTSIYTNVIGREEREIAKRMW